MAHTSTASIKAARGLAAGLIALSVYRAVTQSVTPGEAWNYNVYIAPEWTQAFSGFDSNNHFLNTLLVRIVATRLHITELWLRLPSLLCGGLYLAAAWRLARRMGSGAVFLAGFGMLTLHPMIVDGLSEARGYGMGLAFWSWGLVLLLECCEADSRRKLNLAGVCLGLSVASAPAFLAPASALVLVFAAWKRGRGGEVAACAFLTAFLLLVIPVNHAEWKPLAVGATSLRQTINELSRLTFGSANTVLAAVARVGVAVVAIVGAAAAWTERRQDDGLTVLTGGTLAVSLMLLLLAHGWKQVPFPQGGSIYLVILLELVFMQLLLKLHTRTAQITLLVLPVLLVGRYLTELPLGAYAAGRDVSGGRELAKHLRTATGDSVVRIGATPGAAPILEFYKTRYRKGNWQVVSNPPGDGAEFSVSLAGEPAAAGQLRVLYHDQGMTLYQRF